MKTMLLMIVTFGQKVLNGSGSYRAPSYHRMNLLGGDAFVVCEFHE